MQLTSIIDRLSSGAVFIAASHLTLELTNNFLPVAYPLFIEELGLSYAQIGIVALVSTSASTILQPLFGYLSDRFDSRLLLLLSVVWIGTIMGLAGLAPSYALLILIVGLGGLGSAAFHPAAASLATAAAGRRRGAAMSLFSVGGNLGAALSPLLIGAAILRVGLPGTAFLIPVIWLFSLVLFLQLGNLPADARLEERRRESAASQQKKAQVKVGPWLAVILVILMTAARSWFQGALNTYLPEWLQGQGWTPENANTLLSVLLVSVAAGSLTGGTISDRVGRLPVVLTSFFLLGPALWLLLHSSGIVQVASIAMLGVMIGSTFPVTLLMAQESWPQAVGLASSLAIGFGWLPSGMGAWFVGTLADRTSLTTGLTTLIVAPLFGILVAVLFWARYRRS
jgi:FSR family fosmidomycin resistance protein-like MFS transporter